MLRATSRRLGYVVVVAVFTSSLLLFHQRVYVTVSPLWNSHQQHEHENHGSEDIWMLLASSPQLGATSTPEISNSASEHLVIAHRPGDDLTWVSRHFDNMHTELVPANEGTQAAAYLTYIINFYDSLPDTVIFVHTHEKTSQAAEELATRLRMMISRLNRDLVKKFGYFNLRCEWDPGCPARHNLAALSPPTESNSPQTSAHLHAAEDNADAGKGNVPPAAAARDAAAAARPLAPL